MMIVDEYNGYQIAEIIEEHPTRGQEVLYHAIAWGGRHIDGTYAYTPVGSRNALIALINENLLPIKAD